jgi:hypothetical protein
VSPSVRRRAAGAMLVLTALLAPACGGGAADRREAAERWLAAVGEERWPDACAIMIDPPADCAGSLSEKYGGHELRMLGPGEYLFGDEVTDNDTLFAFLARSSQGQEKNSVFEVVSDPPRIRLVFMVECWDAC